MQRSESINELAGALAKAQAEMKAAAKSAENEGFKRGGKASTYAPLNEIIESAKALHKHGLSYLQPASSLSDGSVSVSTVLLHSSGQWVSEELHARPTQNTPQGIGSAITYLRRYGLSALIGIAADEDDDGNAASKRPEAVAPPPVDEDQSAIHADEFRAALDAAKTLDDVLKIGANIAKAGKERRLSDADRDALKPVFAAKKKDLTPKPPEAASA